jgi:alkylation response protein AidB-like acyl-CoA dehydrogenase
MQHLKNNTEDKGDHYLLNGTKNWITNGGTAQFFSDGTN